MDGKTELAVARITSEINLAKQNSTAPRWLIDLRDYLNLMFPKQYTTHEPTHLTNGVFDLAAFSVANRARCEAANGFNHTMDSWHPSQWTNALAGEAGEACNVTKKMLRYDLDIRGNVKPGDLLRSELQLKAMREIADTIIYGDLAIHALDG